MVFDPVASFHIAYDFSWFSILSQGIVGASHNLSVARVPIENLNFKGMLALCLTPLPSMGRPYAASNSEA